MLKKPFSLFIVATFCCFSVIGQVACEDYRVVSIYDFPPTPATPGGNYFLLLLTLTEDHPDNIDNYANLFFLNVDGDTISIPTGTNSTLPRFRTDTIPYILKLNSPRANQDFPEDFDGVLVIIHGNGERCEVRHTDYVTSIEESLEENAVNIYPNPFNSYARIEAIKQIRHLSVIGEKGRVIHELKPESNEVELRTEILDEGIYLILLHYNDASYGVYKGIKQ